MSIPIFLYAHTEPTIKSPGEYVVHTRTPRCVGRVTRQDGKVRVEMAEKWEEMTPEDEKKLCNKMMKWVFYKYEQTK